MDMATGSVLPRQPSQRRPAHERDLVAEVDELELNDNAPFRRYIEGQAEGKPGHKPIVSYKLPSWVVHPDLRKPNKVWGPEAYMGLAAQGVGNSCGYNQAHVAAQFGDLQMLKLASVAELSARDEEGKVPAHYAVQNGFVEVLDFLRRHRAEVKARDKHGRSPHDMLGALPDSRREAVRDVLERQTCPEDAAAAEVECSEGPVPTETSRVDHETSQAYDELKHGLLGDPHAASSNSRPSSSAEHVKKEAPPEVAVSSPGACLEPEVAGDSDNTEIDLVAPELSSQRAALLFPGQGSQYVGMLEEVQDLPEVRDMLSSARRILGYDLLEVCQDAELLKRTECCQTSVFVAGLAALARLRAEHPDIANAMGAVAGLSLGEYVALVAAGVFSFEVGLHLVKVRAEAMLEASCTGPEQQGMVSIAGLGRQCIEELCREAREAAGSGAVAELANALWPQGFSCGGTMPAMLELQRRALAEGALQARVLQASGAFHTSLMAPARAKLESALRDALPEMRPPHCTVYSNAQITPIAPGTDPSVVCSLLTEQLTSPVLWGDSIARMVQDGFGCQVYELGPGKQLKAVMRRIDPDVWKDMQNVEV